MLGMFVLKVSSVIIPFLLYSIPTSSKPRPSILGHLPIESNIASYSSSFVTPFFSNTKELAFISFTNVFVLILIDCLVK